MTEFKTVAIIGGGFSGIKAAERLERLLPADWRIELLSKNNYITFNPLLPEVVGASLLPGHVLAPIRQMVKRCAVRMVNVVGIDLDERRIDYVGEGPGGVNYDHLVLAFGQVANLDVIKGMANYALPLKTVGDALFLRNRVIVRLEQAELQPDPVARRWLTSFVVIGGGFSGVEVAGELLDFLHAACRYYPRVPPEDISVHLLHGTDQLLPELSPSLGEFTLGRMTRLGVKVRLSTRAVRVDDQSVYVDNGDIIRAGTVICTIGTAPNPILDGLPIVLERGRVVVAPDMSVPGFTGVWAVGDCAAVPNAYNDRVSPPTAQYADRQGRQVAHNVAAAVRGAQAKVFFYRPQGQLSAIGHNKAVAEIYGLRLAGFVAWLLWRGLYLLKIPTLARKARLFLEWNWAMFFPPDIAHLSFVRTKRGRARIQPVVVSKDAA